MIAAIALAYAGPGAVLATRPTGVTHVYVGPATPSGRSVPRGRRAVCRAHTRRLTILDPGEATGRVCARCAACLVTPRARQAAALVTRDQYRARFAAVTGRLLVAALADATTVAEVDQVGHLTLVLFDVTGCQVPDPDTGKSLHDHVTAARHRVAPRRNVAASYLTDTDPARHRRAADRAAAYELEQQRIARIGIRNARPTARR